MRHCVALKPSHFRRRQLLQSLLWEAQITCCVMEVQTVEGILALNQQRKNRQMSGSICLLLQILVAPVHIFLTLSSRPHRTHLEDWYLVAPKKGDSHMGWRSKIYHPVQKVSDLRPGKISCIPGGGSIPNPLQSRPLVTPHT
jgi:hypothetical protein